MMDLESDKILIKGVNMLNIIGFIITFIGTVVGLFALKMTIDINKKTKEIQTEIKYAEIKTIFRFKKVKIQKDLNFIYGKLQNGSIEMQRLKVTLVEIKQFENTLSKKLNDEIGKMDGIIESIIFKRNENKINELISLVHEIREILDNDIEVFK